MIKNLVFDFGKVLVDYDFEQFFEKYIPNHEKCLALTRLLNNEALQQRVDRELSPFDDIMEELIAQNNDLEQEIRIFTKHYTEIVTNEVEGMSDLLQRLKDEGFMLYGLSNWCSRVHETMCQYDIFKLLDGQIISSDEKVIKPEPEIYHRLFSKFNIKPEECVFTDDKVENVKMGRRMGMHGIVFVDAKQYETELRNYL